MKILMLQLCLIGLFMTGILAFFQIVQAEELRMFNGEIRFLNGDFLYRLDDQIYNLSAQATCLADLAENFDGTALNFANLSNEEIQNFWGKIIQTVDKKFLYVFVHTGQTLEIADPDWQMSFWQIDQINASLQHLSIEEKIQKAEQVIPGQSNISLAPELIHLADLINQERAEYNLPALRLDEKLCLVAQDKVDEMYRLNYFHHVSPSGLTPGKRLNNFKYAWTKMGENLAKTHSSEATVVQVFQLWKNSATHYANMISKDYQMIGLARHGQFWAQELVTN